MKNIEINVFYEDTFVITNANTTIGYVTLDADFGVLTQFLSILRSILCFYFRKAAKEHQLRRDPFRPEA